MIGCGAVGSLFAANLGTLDDVEVWAYDPWQEHVDAINANGLRLSGAGEVDRPRAGDRRPGRAPACDLGIVATKSMHTVRGDGRDRARLRGRRGLLGAERRRERGADRGARQAT